MKLVYNNWIIYFNWLLMIAIIVCLLIGAFLSYQYGDDYLVYNELVGRPFIKQLWFQYMTWDGRVLSVGGLMRNLLILKTGATFSIIIFLITYLITCIILKKLLEELQIKTSRKGISMVIFTAFMVAIWPVFKDIVYWQTGGQYSFWILQIVLIIYLFTKEAILRIGSSKSINHPFTSLLIVLICSLNTQNLIFPVFLVFAIYLVYQFAFLKQKPSSLQYLLLLSVILGQLVINLAPGNFVRLSSESKESFTLLELVFNYINILLRAANYSKISLIGGLVLGLYFSSNSINSKFTNKNLTLLSIAFFLMAIFSLAPFIIAPVLARVRVFFSFMLFGFIGSIVLGYVIGRLSGQKLKWFKEFGLTAYFLYGAIFFFWQISIFIPFSKEVSARENILQNAKGSNEIVVYKALPKPNNLYLVRSPIYGENNGWRKDLETFFGIKEFQEIQE
ncbi:DUF6056 family protein [Fulvivirgaceae bacterium LMO-SS25]